MRSRLSAPAALLFLLSTTILLAPAARADDTYDEEYEEAARVLRVSLLKGEVSLKRAGGDEWERARLNTPLVEGDLLATGRDSRLEIQVDARNFVRVGPDSALKIATLRDEGIALSLSEGTATVRLSRFDKDREYFELDAPRTTVAAERTGQYRVDVERGGAVLVTVREDGRARIYSQNSGFTLRNNRTARLTFDGLEEGDWEFSAAAGFDEWDHWNDERERYLASRMRYEGRERYYDPEVYGAEELDLYGDWVHTRDYGYVWRPHVTAVNRYPDWAPYRYGRWEWCPPYGWTWVADEEWGWAPYHYGRWVYVNNYWCWAPRGYGYGRALWRPALVAFVTIDFGRERHVCWYPLTYGQRDPRGRWWSRRYEPLTPLRGRELEHLRRANPALLRAVTTAPLRDFGAATLRARPAAGDLAQRALASDPVRGQLPISRADSTRAAARPGVGATAGSARPTGENGREVLTINRPSPVMPPRALPDRPTGAAARTPGVPLDGELRRTRVFNNREPRVASPHTPGGGSQGSGSLGGETGTGAVERPRTPDTSPSKPGGGDVPPTRVRPTRPPTPVDPPPGNTDEGEAAPTRRNEAGDEPAPRRTRSTRPIFGQPPVERQREEHPRDDGSNSAPVYRPGPRVRPRDEGERAAPPPRHEEPSPRRVEPPSHEPKRSAPPESRPSREPPPRQEAPRSEPRHEQPRQDAPRHEPPRREAPRQEAPRPAPPRQERDPDAPRVRERP